MAILMNTHNIHFYDKKKGKKILKYPLINVFLSFLWTQKRVRISHGKRVVGVWVIEVLLYLVEFGHGTVFT